MFSFFGLKESRGSFLHRASLLNSLTQSIPNLNWIRPMASKDRVIDGAFGPAA
jgi:hypothetical protein